MTGTSAMRFTIAVECARGLYFVRNANPMILEQLTDEQIDAMEARPEIDRLVLMAVGATEFDILPDGFEDGDFRSNVYANAASPSRDCNHAMYAAEKFHWQCKDSMCRCRGLLTRWALHREPRMFAITRLGMIGPDSIARAQTGPLAICRAILKLARGR